MKQNSDDSRNPLALDHHALYEVLRTRDERFDGRIFVAVKTTRIYCRPICRARLPKIENCMFYPIAAMAEKHGYRPCLICRPELAPGETMLAGVGDAPSDERISADLANRIVRRIEDGVLNDHSVDDLASEFDISARYLRIVLARYIGVTPVELAQTRRLLHAKQMLTESNLNIVEVAFAAGFNSLRQFNHVFKKKYRLAPRDFRKALPLRNAKSSAKSAVKSTKVARASQHECVQLRLDYRPPLNWLGLTGFLGTRAIPGVEHVEGQRYLRSVAIGEYSGWVIVEQRRGSEKEVRNSLQVSISDSLVPVSMQIMASIRSVFDVRADVAAIELQLREDTLLAATVKKYSGMRLPGAFDGFELLLRAILGQQISVKGATTLAGRFAKAFGDRVDSPFLEITRSTPSAERLADAEVSCIQEQGLPHKRAATIKAAARAMCDGKLQLSPGADPAATAAALIEIPGIGEWTADYVAMRALDWPDAFPSGDLGVKKAMNLTKRKDVLARAEAWRPWRAYATMYLWLSLAGD